MIISVTGQLGAGKTTVAKKLAEELDLTFYNNGSIFRDLAKKRGMNLVEYLKYGETHPEVDTEIDDYQKNLGETHDNFIIDSRLGWHFIPQSLKIFFTVDPAIGAQRIFKELQTDQSRNEDNGLDSAEKVLESNKKRMATDTKRYEALYGIDPFNPIHFDIAIDTTELNSDKVFDETINQFRPYLKM